MAGSRSEQDSVQPPVEALQGNKEGVRIKFVNPELLRAYILDPQASKKRPTLAERIGKIREVVLGELSLDGDFFKSVKFALITELAPDPEVKGSTVIVRGDLELGERNSEIKKFQTAKANREYVENEVLNKINNQVVADDNFSQKKGEVVIISWDNNIASSYLYAKQESEEVEPVPVTITQIWDRDVGEGSISISLFSLKRFQDDYLRRDRELTGEVNRKKRIEYWDNFVLTIDRDERNTWAFTQRVGIDVSSEKLFQKSLMFYEETFRGIVSLLYQSEGLPVPNLSYEIEPPLIFKEEEAVTFDDIGGQDNAVSALKALAEVEKKNIRGLIGQGRSVLLEGPPGNGKSSLVQALAHELNVPLVKKTSLDLPRSAAVDIIGLFDAWHLEAKSMAKRSGGKAVYCIEGLEVFLQNPMLHDMFLNILEKWESDPEVLFIATTNFPDNLHGGIRSRFSELPILQPGKNGIKEILRIHAGKIAKILGRDVFSGVDFEKVAQRLKTDKNVSGREIVKFLGGAYSLGRLNFQPIDTGFILSLLPDRTLGFKTS